MFGRIKIIVAIALVIALLAVGVGSTTALAQGPTPTPTTPPGGKNLGQLYWEALAKKLGISVEKLQQSMTDARKDALDQAVKQGLLTQAQVDKLKQRAQRLGQLRNAYAFFGKNAIEGAAQALGMKPEEVLAALRRGKTLADLAKEKGVDPAKVQQAIVDAEKAALDQAVKDGKITKERADALKAKLDSSKIDLSRKYFDRQRFMERLRDRLKDRFQDRRGRLGRLPLPFAPRRW